MKLFLVFWFVWLLNSSSGFKRTLPVLLLDNDAVMGQVTVQANPFEILSSEFFTELALDAVKRTECVVIFIEETLCTEDISSKDSLGTPFYNLQKGISDKKVIYMPAVKEPYDLLTRVFEPDVSNIFHLGAGEKLRIQDDHKYVYVYFQDNSEMSRMERLRKHDSLMKEIYFTVKQIKAGPILAFYTGKRNPIKVEQLKYSPPRVWETPKERGVMVVTPDALFRLTDVVSSTKSRRAAFKETPVVEYERRTRSTLSTRMLVTDFHLQFNFEFQKDIWKLANVALLEAGEEVGRTLTAIEAPWSRSYYCSEPITIHNLRDGSSITISEYQIEPLTVSRTRRQEPDDPEPTSEDPPSPEPTSTEPSNSDPPKPRPFSNSVNCGPYFNTVIISGLFIFVIFTVITLWGVIMMMSCATNDRYEDPNQKPLVIAQEAGGL